MCFLQRPYHRSYPACIELFRVEAKSREAKVGCVFTQTRLDEEKGPVRDDGSTTYVGAIEIAEPFGWQTYSEALRRGLRRAEQVTVLGDGAPWIWGIAEEHFPSSRADCGPLSRPRASAPDQ